MNAKGQEGGNAEGKEPGRIRESHIKEVCVSCISGNTVLEAVTYSHRYLSCSQNPLSTSDAALSSVIDIQREAFLRCSKPKLYMLILKHI